MCQIQDETGTTADSPTASAGAMFTEMPALSTKIPRDRHSHVWLQTE